MTERPILFSAPMIRALLSGVKTQTRRPVKLPPWIAKAGGQLNAPTTFKDRGFGDGEYLHVAIDDGSVQRVYCPYADTPGDRLWVREAWTPTNPGALSTGVLYRADFGDDPRPAKYRPSIHMPRWASRITLEVTGVRVERLQDISVPDCHAEGIEYRVEVPAKTQYARLLESINGAGTWDANPFVWVLEFKKL